jgi:hypothetical protein
MNTSSRRFIDPLVDPPEYGHRRLLRALAVSLMLCAAHAGKAQELNPSAHKALGGGRSVITDSTLDTGGGSASGGSFSVVSTVGQPDVGNLSSPRYRIQGGFWVEQGSASVDIFRNGFE